MPGQRHAVIVCEPPALCCALDVDAHLARRNAPERFFVKSGGDEVG